MNDSYRLVGGFILIAVFFIVYFLPTICAGKNRNQTAIFVLNLFLGWTLIGWIVALVWACMDQPKNRPAPFADWSEEDKRWAVDNVFKMKKHD